jgi:8-oxo-dGTP pyrophosphatase MutT (NUDIX family)
MQVDFYEFIDQLAKRLTLPLPGSLAHEPLRAVSVKSAMLTFNHKLPPKPGSVIILLYHEEGEIKFPLTKRATYKGTHSGQISFPGGKAEAGETDIETALRECEEEIGIKQSEMKVIGKLSDFFVIPSNFIVTPVVAYVDSKPVYKPDSIEVATIIEGSLSLLLDNLAVKEKEILVANEFKMQAPHFEIEGEIVWGATAMMLNEFRMLAKELLV